jgi:hypothetical protein
VDCKIGVSRLYAYLSRISSVHNDCANDIWNISELIWFLWLAEVCKRHLFFSDVVISAFSVIPSASKPLIGSVGMNGLSFSATLSNAASASTGNDIQQVTSNRKNFEIGALYSTSSTLTAPFVPTFYPTLTLVDTQQTLIASGSAITITGSIDYPAMTAAECNANTNICIVVKAGATASYVELAAEAANNYMCQSLVRTCSPDPEPSGLTTSTTFTGGQSSAVAFQLTVTNVASGSSGNDILAATGTNTNFKVYLMLSDVNMKTSVDTLRLTSVEATIALSELQSAVAANSGTVVLGNSATASATLFIPEAECSQVSYLCAILYAGSKPSYIDASTIANPSNLGPNITCLDITGQKTCNPGEYLFFDSKS